HDGKADALAFKMGHLGITLRPHGDIDIRIEFTGEFDDSPRLEAFGRRDHKKACSGDTCFPENAGGGRIAIDRRYALRAKRLDTSPVLVHNDDRQLLVVERLADHAAHPTVADDDRVITRSLVHSLRKSGQGLPAATLKHRKE